jgi:hypothetical protein
MAKPGDVFATRQPKGQYGAIRIIHKRSNEYLVYCTTYLGRTRPCLDAPELRKWVVHTRFEYAAAPEPAMVWMHAGPPRHLELIGNIAPTAAERKRKCMSWGYDWSAITDDVYYEWRWRNDRERYEREEYAARARADREELAPKRRQKPKAMMALPVFWSLIAKLDWRHEGRDEKVIGPVVKALATKSVRVINTFEERLAKLLYDLDTKAHAMRTGGSDDGFLYSRCACVAKGRKFYESVRASPRKMPVKLEFESLLGIAATAYEKKTGREFGYRTGCSHETGSNPKGWAE